MKRLTIIGAFAAIITALGFGAWSTNQVPADAMPRRDLTPGRWDERWTVADICEYGFSKRIRPSREVSQALKYQVFQRYGIPWSRHSEFVLDHVCPLDLGGTSTLDNLFPEPSSGPWNSHVKDALEVKLARLVCEGKLDLRIAREQICQDWIACYKRHIGNQPREWRHHRAESIWNTADQ